MADVNDPGQLIHYQVAEGTEAVPLHQWRTNSAKRHAFRLWSDFELIEDSTECLVPQLPEPQSLTVDNFSEDGQFFKTQAVTDDFGGEDVCLSLDDRIISLLIDQSGSMTWNDNPKMRHRLAERIVQRSAATYPGNLTYNIFKYNGAPVQTTIFGVVETNEIDGDDIQTVSNTFFQDDESNFAGVRVVRKTGSFPTSPLDGDIVAEGFLSKVADTQLKEGVEYFYKIFTFDKNFHFSDGVEIKAVPRVQDIPFGIANFSSEVFVGSGIKRDASTLGIWHFDEGDDKRLYDFSDTNSPLVWNSGDPLWLNGDIDIPVGLGSVRFNGLDSGASTETASSKLAISSKMTFMAWVYPYDLTASGIIAARQNNSDTNFLVKHNASSGLEITVDGSTFAVSDPGVLTERVWNHIAITADLDANTVSFFVSGIGAGTSTFPSAVTNSTDDMFFDIGFDRLALEPRFFGKMTEVSLHNIERDTSYIEEAAVPSDDENIGDVTTEDNGDRLVVLSYDVPSDLTFSGGNVRIVRNAFNEPSWEEDGDIISDIPASVGRVYIADPFDFVLGSNYQYKLFTQNSIGNFSFSVDSPNLDIAIPLAEGFEPDPLSPSLSAPSNLTAQIGNKKVFLKWQNAVLDDRISRVEVYHSTIDFPVTEEGENVSGTLVFEGDINDTKFVHREVTNDRRQFYTVVTKDRFGRFSAPTNIVAVPAAEVDEIGIPLLDVKNVGYEIINNNGLSINWENPIEFIVDLEAFFDQKIFIYAALTDEFGRQLPEDVNITLNITPDLTFLDQSEDVFGDISTDTSGFTDSAFFSFSVSKESGGILKGALRMTEDLNRLSLLERADFSVEVFSFIPDPESPLDENGNPTKNLFEFHSQPVTMSLTNPFSMDLVNRDNRRVSEECPKPSDGPFGTDSVEPRPFDGAYIRSDNPFIARTTLSFRGEALPGEATVKVAVWDASAPLCGDAIFSRIEPSSTVLAPSSELPVQSQLVPVIGEDGEVVEDEFERLSFVDIPLTVPDFPQKAILFVQGTFNGYTITKQLDLVMQNILQIELSARPPIGNGFDIAEQRANVFLLDPDFPEDDSKRTLVPDLTIVRWRLTQGQFGQARPFYSIDTVPTVGGVFSRVRNGVARNVLFGPASDVEPHVVESPDGVVEVIGEKYSIAANIVYDGLTAEAGQEIEILPFFESKTDAFGPRLLMEFPEFKNVIWSDGQDFKKLIISRDPNNPADESKFDDCFRQCLLDDGTDITPLTAGQIIRITSDENVEILHGNIIEQVDPYDPICGKDLIIGEGGFSSKGSALVEIEDSKETVVYFRINDFFKPLPPGETCPQDDAVANLLGDADDGSLNPCECLGITKDEPIDNLCTELTVTGAGTLLFNNEAVTLVGGGGMEDGIPPTILVPREPLSVSIVEKRVNGVPSNTFVIDNESINEVLLEVSFAGCTVPDGTVITAEVVDSLSETNVLELEETVLHTRVSLEPTVDSVNERSYALARFKPVPVEGVINETVRFASTFDRKGEVEREISTCIQVQWDPGDNPSEPEEVEEEKAINSVFSGDLFAYNTVTDEWTELQAMNSARSYPNFHFVGGKGYSIGGLDESTISKINEEYDPSTDTWTLKGVMPTARFGAMSVVVNDEIYVIGGLTGGNFGEALAVSVAVEKYIPATDTWEVLADMPVVADGTISGRTYGVVFGVAKHVSVSGSDRIYILSGLTEVDQNGQVEAFNDRILYYDVAADDWVVSDLLVGDELEAYRRISPTAFEETTGKIVVNGGAVTVDKKKGSGIRFATDSYSYIPSTDTFEINDFEFETMPVPRYRAASVSFGTDHFLVGGSDVTSQTLKILERVDSSIVPYPLETRADIPRARTGLGAAGVLIALDPYRPLENHVFVVGGFSSGRPEGFLQINTSSRPGTVRLDGRQSAMVNFSLADEGGQPPDKDIRVAIRGFVKVANVRASADEAEETQTDEFQASAAERLANREAIYPVLFTSSERIVSGGESSVTLKPRADDILQGAEEILERAGIDVVGDIEEALGLGSGEVGQDEDAALVINTGEIRNPYSILVELTIIDDEFFGQTVEVLPEDAIGLTEAERERLQEQQAAAEAAAADEAGAGGGVSSSEECDIIVSLDTSVSWESFSIGISTQGAEAFGNFNNSTGQGATERLSSESGSASSEGTEEALQFGLVPSIKGQSSSPTFSYFIDIDWVPSVEKVDADNTATASEAVAVIENLSNEIPFGASALFDAMVSASRVLSDNDVDSFGKVIYVFTDNESNMSVATVDEAIEEVNAIDGDLQSPTVIGNFSVVDPITLSAKANTSDTDVINKIATETGGQSVSVLSEEFENEIVQVFTGSAVGSLGYGTYDKIIDLGEIVELKTITAVFELFENTTGTWTISVSEDGHTYTPIRGEFKANEQVEFERNGVRFIRLSATLRTGFTASNLPEYELIPLPGSPCLKEVIITFEKAHQDDLFLTTDMVEEGPQQVAVAINASKVDPNDIMVGVAKSDSHNWGDYQHTSQPAIPQNGKIFIPIRTRNNEDVVPFEPLEKLDQYTYKTTFGRWDPFGTIVVILDENDDEVDESLYKLYPRTGIVVFNEPRNDELAIKIDNGNQFRVGLRLLNRSSATALEVCGLGYMYNRNQNLLPPVEKLPPQAVNFAVSPDQPGVYEKISLDYLFQDPNNDKEDESAAEIRWFINGVQVVELNGLREWNDVSNPDDPLYSLAFTFSQDSLGQGETVVSKARELGQSIVKVGDVVHATLRVSDGTLTSSRIKSNIVEILESPPEITSVRIRGLKSNGGISDTVTSEDTAIAEFNIGADVSENNSILTWFVNGEEFKTGALGVVENADRILPGETSSNTSDTFATGNFGLTFNNSIFVQVTPQTGDATGEQVTSDTIVVGNSVPTVSNVILGPSNPRSTQDLVVSFEFSDFDVTAGDPQQSNQSTVQWFVSSGGGTFTEVTELAGESVVPKSFTSRGQIWRATVTPFDGLDQGTPVDSNTVQIL